MSYHDWNTALDGAIHVVREMALHKREKKVTCTFEDVMKILADKINGMKIKVITPEKVKKYKHDNGNNCPHCGSNRVTTTTDFAEHPHDTAGVSLNRGMTCGNPDCEEEWIEFFVLDTIMKEDI